MTVSLEVSIVVPCRNEASNIIALVDGIVRSAAAFAAWEVIVVDDGSDDGMADLLAAAMTREPRLRVLRHDRSGGQSAAVHSGVRAARHGLICTLDGDGQNPPEEIPRLVAPFAAPDAAGIGLVAGQRLARQDSLARRLASRFANGLRARVLKDATRDTGCGLKAFRRDAFLALPYFDHMHRYLPALFARDSWEIAHVDVSHRPREGGRSHYSNLQRGLVGIFDLMGVAWLLRRRKKSRPEEILRGAPRQGKAP
ncbi:glycosyltransferase family 2 protein [Rhodobacter sp. Har01]|uniref:glycosyltransferase family 2 protein n=1 Tax=Rhodobacter sp. Har01 TaxID=2883999 RepID=UPI001D076777|nr:glycosyltransferase family 2 protein [Rhodobacter sp. Har01]MCB6179609.1 glycosyltransferase family 2 protein [Rhodobacter sp. Har01]